jgi:3-oxoacyl-[acyl-carrier protein] reductase
MELNLKNKKVLVVGASKGIGKAIALAFAREGSNLLLLARSEELIRGVAAQCKSSGAASSDVIVADITKNPRTIAAQCLNQFGSFDVVIHNVGTSLVPRDIFGTENDYFAAINENALASIQMNAIFIPDMAKKGIKGHVIHISSISAVNLRGNALYASSKAILNAYVTSAGRQLAPSGICLNSVMPGAVAFEGGYWDAAIKAKDPKVDDFLSHHQAIGRFGTPEEIADFVLFLSSERSSFIVASNLPIDGGAM